MNNHPNDGGLGFRRRHQTTRHRVRGGFTIIEVLVTAGLLTVVMSFVSSMVFRINNVWRDTGHQRAAMNELSNQLERLTLMTPDEVSAAIDSLQPSDTVSRTLADPKFSGELIEDDWGHRIVLKLDWQRPYPGKPVQLVGWLPPVSETRVTEIKP